MDEGSSKGGLNGGRGNKREMNRGAALSPGALFAGGSAIDFEQTPPRMDVKFPILGFLKEAEATGYDLKNRFRDPVGFFYRVSDGSIYPALKKLARDGLVTLRSERQGRRTRKVYAITDEGRTHFRRMLLEPAQPLFVFDESQVKIYFADQEPEIAVEHMERAQRDDELRSAILARMVTEMRRSGASPVRRIMVELGCAITAAKAGVLKRLCAQLKSEIQLRRRYSSRSKPVVNGTARGPMKPRHLTPKPLPSVSPTREKGNKKDSVGADKKVNRRGFAG